MNGKVIMIGGVITAIALLLSYQAAKTPEIVYSGPQGPFTTGLTAGGSEHVTITKSGWERYYSAITALAIIGFLVQSVGFVIKEESF